MRAPGLAIALMRKKNGGGEAEKYLDKQREDDKEFAFKDAASEILRYMKSGDEDKFAKALKAAIELCYGDDADEEY